MEANHYPEASGGYTCEDLLNLRNLVVYGSCITRASEIRADIELLHQLQKLIYGIPVGENDPHEGDGPITGGLDSYCHMQISGNVDMCDRLASAAISPVPTQMQEGAWRFYIQVVHETLQHIQNNIDAGRLPVSGDTHSRKTIFNFIRESQL